MTELVRNIAVGLCVAATISLALRQPAGAQDFPSRPVEMLVPWGPGGGADQTGRTIGRLLEPLLKVSVPVENLPGAAGVAGLNKLLGGPSDGYRISVVTADTLGFLAETPPPRWTLSELAPIAVLTVQGSGFFVNANGPFKSWADVEEKAKTTELKVAVTGLGTPDEIAVEALKKRGLKLLAVPFSKPSERYVAVIGGHADLLYEQAGDIRSFIESKQIAPVLFLSKTPVARYPDVKTTQQLGMDLVLDQYRTLMAKAGLPPEELKLLIAKTQEAAQQPEYAKFLDDQIVDPQSIVFGEAAGRYIQEQIDALKRLK